MQKYILGLLLLSLSVVYAIEVSKEQAYKQGESIAVAINMNPSLNYEEKLNMCDQLVKSRAMLGADNRNELLPSTINGCKEAIKGN